MVLAQRLVRRICPNAAQEYEPPRPLRKAIERMGWQIDKFFKGVGCRNCRNTGYSGRFGVHELLIINDELRDAIVAARPWRAIRESGPPQRHDHALVRRLSQSPRGPHHHRRSAANRR